MKKIIALILTIIFITCSFVSCGTSSDKPWSIFGYTPLGVVSPSMEPLIKVGDLIIIKEVDVNDIKVGDVICFLDPTSSSETKVLITHRIADIYVEDGKSFAITVGDMNSVVDVTPLELNDENVIGMYTGTRISSIGGFLNKLHLIRMTF